MSFYYSATTGGFYASDIHNAMPADVVEITNEQHQALLVAQAAGSRIQPDDSCHPIAVAPKPPTLEQIKASLCASIDAARDSAYADIGGNNAGRIQEYAMARDDAVAYRGAAYTGEVPVGVSSWVTPERTARQAADGIIATADAWTAFVGAVRTYTLQGKYAVEAAVDEDAANAAATESIASISAAVAQAQAQTETAEAG